MISLWYFVLDPVPGNYSDCLETRTNDYSRNDLWCTYSPKTSAELRFCKNNKGISGPICLITYYNSDFSFPKTLDECLKKVGSTNNQFCDVTIHEQGAYNKEVASKLYSECIKNGGQKIADVCTIRFEK